MTSSSTRLRFGAALTATSLAVLLGLGGTAAADEKGQGAEQRNARTEVPTEVAGDDDSQVPDDQGDADNAHPSGRDRHEDKGTQGRSTSDPDDDGRGPDRSNGGADKPFATTDGTGGVDQADQDGNNGCGNDDDFEDDNEGWCGRKPERTTPPPPPAPPAVGGNQVTCPEGETMPAGGTEVEDCEAPVVPAVVATGTPVVPLEVAPAAAASIATEVLGVTLERPAAAPAVAAAAPAVAAGATTAGRPTAVLGASLARTGLGIGVLVAVAVGLLGIGTALTRKGERFTA